MALVARLKSEQPLRWEIQLGQALSDFQDTLTSEQRASFQANRIHSSATPPTIRDVMNTTAEVDRQARRDKKGSHQCFGPRFTRFLEVVQQYASIGDVLIGGSQNLIACGVWSLVRVTLLTVCKFSSYLERVSRLFMDIGQSVPQIQDIANIYPDSKTLQRLVADYFLGVVKLCQRLMSLYKQSIAEQLKSFFSDWNAIGQESDLAKSSRAIYEQLQIENAQTSFSSLSRLNSLSSRKRTRQAQKDHYRLLDACSTYSYMSAWKRTRKIGYSKWNFCKTEYDVWTNNPESSTLILKGKLGGGKSVLLANMVDDLNLKQLGLKVIYFFCKEDDATSLESRTVVGCLCRQLLQLLQPGKMVECPSNYTNLDGDDLLDLLRKVLPAKEKVFVILDGIESCALKEENEILNWIRSLQGHLSLALCISCRIDASSMIGQHIWAMKDPMCVTLPDSRPEISDYVKGQLERKTQSGELRFRDPNIQTTIAESLVSRCQGMFLWVHLQLESICQEQTDEAILKALSALPRTLPDLFHDILSRHHDRSPRYQTALLKLLSTVVRPLLVSELEEALSVVPGVISPQPEQMVNNIRVILASCGSLVVVDEEQHTVHFVHHSVEQYLVNASELAKGNKSMGYCFTQQDTQKWMGDIVVTYLSWDRLNVAIARPQKAIEQPIDRIPGKVLDSTLLNALPTTVRAPAVRLSSRYLTQHLAQPQPLGTTVASLKIHTKKLATPGFFFQKYAEEYWLHHTKSTHESSPQMWKLFTQLVSKRWLVTGALLWKDRPPVDSHDNTSWAYYHSHVSMLVRGIDASDSMRLFRIKAMLIVPVLNKATEVLFRAQAELRMPSINLTGPGPWGGEWRIHDCITVICDIQRAQLRYLTSKSDLRTWSDVFQSCEELATWHYIIREPLLERYVFAFNSIFEQLNNYQLALQALCDTAEDTFLKRCITLAIYAIETAMTCPAGVSPEVLIGEEVKALILHVDDWIGFPITKAGLVKKQAQITARRVLQEGEIKTLIPIKSAMFETFYIFADYLLFVRQPSKREDPSLNASHLVVQARDGDYPGLNDDRAWESDSDNAEPEPDDALWIPYWHCRIDQVLCLIPRSVEGAGMYELQTTHGSLITFRLHIVDPEEWLEKALPSVQIDPASEILTSKKVRFA